MNPILSMTKSAVSTDCADVRAIAAVEAIRAGRWREPVEQIRAAYARAVAAGRDAKESVADFKKRLPGLLWSGKFERRRNDALVAHSGLLCADLDNLGDRLPAVREKLVADPHVYAVFLSPTGTGLKVVFRVVSDAAQHGTSFAAVAARLRTLYGVEADPAAKDLARLCFVSSDENAFLNRDALGLPIPGDDVTHSASGSPAGESITGSNERTASAMPALPLPAPAGKLPPSLDRFLATGAERGQRNAQCFRLACQLRDAGLGEAEAETRILEFAARCNPPLAAREARTSLRSAYAKPPREPARNVARVLPGSVAAEYLGNGDEATFARLAALAPADYDRQREAEAERLGIRTSTLDAEVAKRRAPVAGVVQGGAVEFAPVPPWPSPVDGPAVLADVAQTFDRYVVLSSHAADALALWAAHAHAFEVFQHSPRLNLHSPEKQCGKTLLLDVLASLVSRPLRTENITPAVLFRIVELHKPTLLLDEVDCYLSESDELRGLLNAGHKRGARAYRCEGEKNEVRAFAAFAPAALAGIGSLPGTLHDRSIVIRLVRAKPGEVTARFDSRRTAHEAELCRKLARWTADNLTRLEAADPALPESAYNRLADNWRPLFAVAEAAGADWPRRATEAFGAMTATEDMDAQGLGVMLLADIRKAYGEARAERLFSKKLVDALNGMTDRPWPEAHHGRPITETWLARRLRHFGVSPCTLRIADERAKGYELAALSDAFDRFLPEAPSSKRDSVTSPVNTGPNPCFQSVTPLAAVTDAEAQQTPENTALSRCHASPAPLSPAEASYV